jgi:hypothetical protein
MRESEAFMKSFVLAALALLASMPALAQDQSSCKAFFQVLQAEEGSPGLRPGLNSAQKRWWEDKGQKKYPGLCFSGAVTSGDKPRYLVIWSKSKKVGSATLAPTDGYGQTGNTLQATAPATKIYTPRWDQAAVTIINVQYDGSLMLPPVYYESDDHAWILFPDSVRVLKDAVKYLFQEQVFLTKTS